MKCVTVLTLLLLTFFFYSVRAQRVLDVDFDGNGQVEFLDFLAFARAFGSTQSRYDLNGNGRVDFPDFLTFASRFDDSSSAPASGVNPETLLNTLEANHPRLMLKEAVLEALKVRWQTDPALKKIVSDVLGEANKFLNKASLKHELRGPRLLHVSRDCLNRIYHLALAWRCTGDARYFETARNNLLTVSAFPNWNPSHFLDVAEMSHAVAIGYDWLFHTLNPADRKTIKAALIRHGLQPGVDAYAGKGPSKWWPQSAFNWNQVCNGGLIVGALAIAETDPEYAQQIIPEATQSLPLALETYNPDGAWGEGPGYWHYATRYTAYGLSALETALGHTFDLTHRQGLSRAGHFPIYASGPMAYYFNYADAGEKSRRNPMGCTFWLARTYNDLFTAAAEHQLIKIQRASPQHLMWYVTPPDPAVLAPDLDKLFRGEVEVAFFRSGWNDPNATFLAVKAGHNEVNHAHLDLGNFVLDAMGLRWAKDLGSDDYNLPGYFNKNTGQRWTYYRLNSESHNIPLINGKSQDPAGRSRIARFRTDNPVPFAVVDLSEAYGNARGTISRGVALVNNRQDVLIQDEFDLEVPRFITWGMTTDAAIEILPDGEALLTLEDKHLRAKILSPQGWKFGIGPAEQPAPQKTNKGTQRLVVRPVYETANLRLSILLTPVRQADESLTVPDVKPLSTW